MTALRLLADGVVVAHAAYVGFVVVGLVLILLGVVMRWQWVRNFWFRVIHFAMIGVVVLEALAGISCPLTLWEDALREKAGETVQEGTFIGRLAHELLFFDVPEAAFTPIYCLVGALVLATLVFAPPRWPRGLCRGALTKSLSENYRSGPMRPENFRAADDSGTGSKNLSPNCHCGSARPEDRNTSQDSGIGSKVEGPDAR